MPLASGWCMLRRTWEALHLSTKVPQDPQWLLRHHVSRRSQAAEPGARSKQGEKLEHRRALQTVPGVGWGGGEPAPVSPRPPGGVCTPLKQHATAPSSSYTHTCTSHTALSLAVAHINATDKARPGEKRQTCVRMLAWPRGAQPYSRTLPTKPLLPPPPRCPAFGRAALPSRLGPGLPAHD